VNQSERKNRIVFSLMMLPAKMANEFELSLKDTKHWLETAHFHTLRQKGRTLKEIAKHLKIGSRKTSQLSEKLRKNFLLAEHDFGLPRRIEYLVWGEPISRKRVQQLLGSEYEVSEINEAIDQLVQQKRIQSTKPLQGRGIGKELFELSRKEARLYEDGFLSRIDGLNHLVDTFYSVILQRFVKDNKSAFARTLTLRIPVEGGDEMLAELYESIFESLSKIENRIGDKPSKAIDLSIFWAPKKKEE